MQDVDFRLILWSNVEWQAPEKVLRRATAPVYLMDWISVPLRWRQTDSESEQNTFFDEVGQVPSLVVVLCAKLHAGGTWLNQTLQDSFKEAWTSSCFST